MTQARPWLQKQYHRRRKRTVALVKDAISVLRRQAKAISIASIVTTTRTLDSEGKGISASAVLQNPDANELYKAARTWRPTRARRPKPTLDFEKLPLPVRLGRNVDVARHRLSKLTKPELIARLLTVEHAYARLYQANLQGEALELEKWIEEHIKLVHS